MVSGEEKAREKGAAELGRLRFVGQRLAAVPLAFFGVGVYRAWLALFFRYDAFPGVGVVDYFVFEGAIGIASFALAFAAARVTPLWSNRRATAATWTAMTGGSALLVLSCFFGVGQAAKLAGLVLSGAGLASLILMWAEFYGSLNPLRVALYHAIALMVGECLKWLFLGMVPAYLAFFSVVLPSVSIVQVRVSMRHLPKLDRPVAPRPSRRRPFPYKLILLMSTCTFVGGYSTVPAMELGVGSIAGTLAVCGLVAVGVLSMARWFNFDTVYRLAFPLFTVGFMLAPAVAGPSGPLMGLCYDAGYSMMSMLVMLVLSNVTYRFGISAVWVNGIERGVRYAVEVCGCAVGMAVHGSLDPESTRLVGLVMTAVLATVFVVVFYQERHLSANWGLRVEGVEDARVRQDSMAVSELSRERNLSPREEEVFQLLVRGESVAQVAEHLFVSQGTVKAHVSHIYQKLGVHSRDEMFSLVRR